jgi:hypothetical protein
MKKYFGSIWFWWLFLTSIYTLFNLLGYPCPFSEWYEYHNKCIIPFISYVAAFIGLFVPFGITSLPLLFAALMHFSLLSLGPIFFIISMILFGVTIKETKISIFKKMILCLVMLLIFTTVVDGLRDTAFESWKILFNGQFSYYNFHFSF